MISKIQKICQYLFVWVFCFTGILVGANVPFAYFLLSLWLSWLFSYKISLKFFQFYLFSFAFIVRFSYILVVRTPLESDFALLFDAAVRLAQEGYDFSSSLYFQEWAYQTAFVLYESVVIKLFGATNAQIALKIIQALLSSGVCVLIYLIARNFADEKAARFAALLSISSVFAVTYVTVLSNQHLATFFLILGVYLLIDKKNLKLKSVVRGLLAGLSISLGNIFRPEGIILLLALFAYFLCNLIKSGEEGRKKIILTAGMLIIIYFGTNALASSLVILTGVNPAGLSNNNPLWKLVVGLNSKSGGIMTSDDVDLVYGPHIVSPEERKTLELKLIRERLNAGPKKLLSLFITKHRLLWGGDPIIWSCRHIQDGNKSVKILGYDLPSNEIYQVMLGLHTLQMFVLISFSLYGAIYGKREHVIEEIKILYHILLITFAVYTIIEIQPRYIYFQQGILYITSAISAEVLMNRLLAILRGKIKQ